MPSPSALDRLAGRLLSTLEQLRALVVLPLALVARLSDRRNLIDGDVTRWLEVLGRNDGSHGLHSLLYAFPEFRALYYHRLASGNASAALAGRLLAHLFRPTPGLMIATGEVGTGLFIAHGHSTCLAAARIGRNCYVHHGVTVGWDYRGRRGPIIGDGVFIGTGAVILGEISIGDGARIGANSVVLCDVPAGATAVGAPARVLGPISLDHSRRAG